MENDESKLRVTLEERIKSAMDRFFEAQATGRKAGGCQQGLGRVVSGNPMLPHARIFHEFSKIKRG